MTGQAGTVCSTCGTVNHLPRTACARCGDVLPLVQIEPGLVVASRYEIREPLGAGGMGVVYKAHDRLLNETVAIKVLRPEAAQTPDAASRFISEIKLARVVSHRNVVRIHEYGEDQGIRYISMAFVDGVDLKRLVRERGPLPPARAFEVMIQAAEGLHAIHEEGIVHRDLKSSNIMVDGHGVVRLMDFGLAKLWSAETPQDMTATGQIVGTPEYMSPEQILGRGLDRGSDIYSLAVVTYEVFTGRTPFRADTPIATLMMHLNDAPPLEGPPAECIPAPVVPLLRRALSKGPENRFAAALEMARALERARTSWATSSTTAVPGRRDAASGKHASGNASLPAAARGLLQPTVTLTPTAIPSITAAAAGPTTVSRWKHPVTFALISALAVAVLTGLFVLALTRLDTGRATVDSSRSAPSPGRTAAPAPALSVAASAAVPSTLPAPLTAPTATGSSISPRPARPAPPSRPGDRLIGATPGSTGTVLGATPAADAQPDGKRQLESHVEAMLTDAGTALEAQRYDDAIALYDQILRLDPHQQIALIARATAVNAKVAARAATVPGPDQGRAFVADKTSAAPADAAPDRAFSQAFEDGHGLSVQQDTQITRPPGRIEFEARPEIIRPGERYTLRVYFVNPVEAPVEIRQMVVTNTVDGRKSSGPVEPSTSTVAPEQRALLLSLSGLLSEGTATWSLAVVVRTSGGETYRNQITWK